MILFYCVNHCCWSFEVSTNDNRKIWLFFIRWRILTHSLRYGHRQRRFLFMQILFAFHSVVVPNLHGVWSRRGKRRDELSANQGIDHLISFVIFILFFFWLLGLCVFILYRSIRILLVQNTYATSVMITYKIGWCSKNKVTRR